MDIRITNEIELKTFLTQKKTNPRFKGRSTKELLNSMRGDEKMGNDFPEHRDIFHSEAKLLAEEIHNRLMAPIYNGEKIYGLNYFEAIWMNN